MGRVSSGLRMRHAFGRVTQDQICRPLTTAIRRSTGLVIASAAFMGALSTDCAASGPAAVFQTPTPLPPGVLIPQAPVINLGNVPLNVQSEAEFDLVNSGGQPVNILGLPHVTILEGC
jgi:hypothetical protein